MSHEIRSCAYEAYHQAAKESRVHFISYLAEKMDHRDTATGLAVIIYKGAM